VCLFAIRAGPPARSRELRNTTIRADIADGLRFVWGDRLLRRLTIFPALANLAYGGSLSIMVVFLVRVAHGSCSPCSPCLARCCSSGRCWQTAICQPREPNRWSRRPLERDEAPSCPLRSAAAGSSPDTPPTAATSTTTSRSPSTRQWPRRSITTRHSTGRQIPSRGRCRASAASSRTASPKAGRQGCTDQTRPSRTDSSASALEDWAGSAVEIDGRACHVRRAIGQEISRQVGELF
jgi:hypothetical protein